jgi:hypothetical protein
MEGGLFEQALRSIAFARSNAEKILNTLAGGLMIDILECERSFSI